MALKNLLGVFQHGFVAELQVQLKTREGFRQLYLSGVSGIRDDRRPAPTFSCSMFFLCRLIFFTSRGSSGIPFPASSSCSAAYSRQRAPVRPTPELQHHRASVCATAGGAVSDSGAARAHSPAVHHHRRVQGPLVEVMSVHLLDEVEQVALAVGETPGGQRRGSNAIRRLLGPAHHAHVSLTARARR